MNPYTELYKSLSNSDLLRIINNPGDYQPLAIEAAEYELAVRQLSIEELAIANNENEIRKNRERAKIKKKRALENIVKTTLFSMGDIIKRPAPKRKIKLIISIILILIFIFQAFSRVDLLKFMFTYDNARWDLPTAFLFIPWLAILIGLLLFGFRKKAGWIILSVYITYSACYWIIEFLVWAFREYPESLLLKRVISPMTYLPSLFLTILFFSGMLWVICRNDIKNDYHINRKTSLLTVGLSFVITIAFYWLHLI
jgi:hypothetical protein